MGGECTDGCWVQSWGFSNSEYIVMKRSMLSLQLCDQINLDCWSQVIVCYSSACFLDNFWRHGIPRSTHRGIRASPPCPGWRQWSNHHLLLISSWKILLGPTFTKTHHPWRWQLFPTTPTLLLRSWAPTMPLDNMICHPSRGKYSLTIRTAKSWKLFLWQEKASQNCWR